MVSHQSRPHIRIGACEIFREEVVEFQFFGGGLVDGLVQRRVWIMCLCECCEGVEYTAEEGKRMKVL